MESTTQNNNIKAKKEVRELFNVIRSNIREDRKEIRKKLHEKKTIYNFLKKKE